MLQILKVIFIFIGALFVVTLLDQQNFGQMFTLVPSTTGTGLTSRSAYLPSYDSDGDGTISDREYAQGEYERIERELERIEREVEKALLASNRSPYQGDVRLGIGDVKTTLPKREYLVIRNWSSERVDIAGWTIRGVLTDRRVVIKHGTRSIKLWSGDVAEIYTGKGDTDYENGVFYVYLDRSGAIWRREREALILYDADGKVVDLVRY